MTDEKKAQTGGNPVSALSTAKRCNTNSKRPGHGLLLREQRILAALTLGPKTREQVDKVGRCSNGPEYIRQLRNRGFVIHCDRRCFVNEEGAQCCPGVYRLDEKSIPEAMELLYLAEAG